MTTMMLVASMIPIALGQGPGAAGRASMAKIIIGGQMLCLLLSLLVTPISYSIFDDWSQGRFFRRRNKSAPKTSSIELAPAGGPRVLPTRSSN
jgi:HAE1 family hydrophobic/amphiphilic exporter-1